jgi:NAD(P)H dehydrogenase (quinone)
VTRPIAKALVVFAHPVRSSFLGALVDRTMESLREAGAEVRFIDLYAEGFEPAMSRADWTTCPMGAVAVELRPHVEALRWADALVLVYPTWFGAQPAMLKGWFDRVWLPDVAFRPPSGPGLSKPRLRNIRSVTVVTSHGSGKLMNALQGEPGKRLALRGIRSLCSRGCRVKWVAFYGNDRAADQDRREFLEKVGRVFGPAGR